MRSARTKTPPNRTTPNQRHSEGQRPYTVAMAAKSGQWKVVKTSGGYGVLRSVNGLKITKSTVVKPSSVAGARVQGATKIGR